MKSYKNQEAQLSTAELPDFMGALCFQSSKVWKWNTLNISHISILSKTDEKRSVFFSALKYHSRSL